MKNPGNSKMKSKVFKSSRGCSSDDIVVILQDIINKVYNAQTFAQAKTALGSHRSEVYMFLKNMVHQMEEDEALAMLAEIDHRLTFVDESFKFEYDTPTTGGNRLPYTLCLKYGDPDLGYISFKVNDLSL